MNSTTKMERKADVTVRHNPYFQSEAVLAICVLD